MNDIIRYLQNLCFEDADWTSVETQLNQSSDILLSGQPVVILVSAQPQSASPSQIPRTVCVTVPQIQKPLKLLMVHLSNTTQICPFEQSVKTACEILRQTAMFDRSIRLREASRLISQVYILSSFENVCEEATADTPAFIDTAKFESLLACVDTSVQISAVIKQTFGEHFGSPNIESQRQFVTERQAAGIAIMPRQQLTKEHKPNCLAVTHFLLQIELRLLQQLQQLQTRLSFESNHEPLIESLMFVYYARTRVTTLKQFTKRPSFHALFQFIIDFRGSELPGLPFLADAHQLIDVCDSNRQVLESQLDDMAGRLEQIASPIAAFLQVEFYLCPELKKQLVLTRFDEVDETYISQSEAQEYFQAYGYFCSKQLDGLFNMLMNLKPQLGELPVMCLSTQLVHDVSSFCTVMADAFICAFVRSVGLERVEPLMGGVKSSMENATTICCDNITFVHVLRAMVMSEIWDLDNHTIKTKPSGPVEIMEAQIYQSLDIYPHSTQLLSLCPTKVVLFVAFLKCLSYHNFTLTLMKQQILDIRRQMKNQNKITLQTVMRRHHFYIAQQDTIIQNCYKLVTFGNFIRSTANIISKLSANFGHFQQSNEILQKINPNKFYRMTQIQECMNNYFDIEFQDFFPLYADYVNERMKVQFPETIGYVSMQKQQKIINIDEMQAQLKMLPQVNKFFMFYSTFQNDRFNEFIESIKRQTLAVSQEILSYKAENIVDYIQKVKFQGTMLQNNQDERFKNILFVQYDGICSELSKRTKTQEEQLVDIIKNKNSIFASMNMYEEQYNIKFVPKSHIYLRGLLDSASQINIAATELSKIRWQKLHLSQDKAKSIIDGVYSLVQTTHQIVQFYMEKWMSTNYTQKLLEQVHEPLLKVKHYQTVQTEQQLSFFDKQTYERRSNAQKTQSDQEILVKNKIDEIIEKQSQYQFQQIVQQCNSIQQLLVALFKSHIVVNSNKVTVIMVQEMMYLMRQGFIKQNINQKIISFAENAARVQSFLQNCLQIREFVITNLLKFEMLQNVFIIPILVLEERLHQLQVKFGWSSQLVIHFVKELEQNYKRLKQDVVQAIRHFIVTNKTFFSSVSITGKQLTQKYFSEFKQQKYTFVEILSIATRQIKQRLGDIFVNYQKMIQLTVLIEQQLTEDVCQSGFLLLYECLSSKARNELFISGSFKNLNDAKIIHKIIISSLEVMIAKKIFQFVMKAISVHLQQLMQLIEENDIISVQFIKFDDGELTTYPDLSEITESVAFLVQQLIKVVIDDQSFVNMADPTHRNKMTEQYKDYLRKVISFQILPNIVRLQDKFNSQLTQLHETMLNIQVITQQIRISEKNQKKILSKLEFNFYNQIEERYLDQYVVIVQIERQIIDQFEYYQVLQHISQQINEQKIHISFVIIFPENDIATIENTEKTNQQKQIIVNTFNKMIRELKSIVYDQRDAFKQSFDKKGDKVAVLQQLVNQCLLVDQNLRLLEQCQAVSKSIESIITRYELVKENNVVTLLINELISRKKELGTISDMLTTSVIKQIQKQIDLDYANFCLYASNLIEKNPLKIKTCFSEKFQIFQIVIHYFAKWQKLEILSDDMKCWPEKFQECPPSDISDLLQMIATKYFLKNGLLAILHVRYGESKKAEITNKRKNCNLIDIYEEIRTQSYENWEVVELQSSSVDKTLINIYYILCNIDEISPNITDLSSEILQQVSQELDVSIELCDVLKNQIHRKLRAEQDLENQIKYYGMFQLLEKLPMQQYIILTYDITKIKSMLTIFKALLKAHSFAQQLQFQQCFETQIIQQIISQVQCSLQSDLKLQKEVNDILIQIENVNCASVFIQMEQYYSIFIVLIVSIKLTELNNIAALQQILCISITIHEQWVLLQQTFNKDNINDQTIKSILSDMKLNNKPSIHNLVLIMNNQDLLKRFFDLKNNCVTKLMFCDELKEIRLAIRNLFNSDKILKLNQQYIEIDTKIIDIIQQELLEMEQRTMRMHKMNVDNKKDIEELFMHISHCLHINQAVQQTYNKIEKVMKCSSIFRMDMVYVLNMTNYVRPKKSQILQLQEQNIKIIDCSRNVVLNQEQEQQAFQYPFIFCVLHDQVKQYGFHPIINILSPKLHKLLNIDKKYVNDNSLVLNCWQNQQSHNLPNSKLLELMAQQPQLFVPITKIDDLIIQWNQITKSLYIDKNIFISNTKEMSDLSKIQQNFENVVQSLEQYKTQFEKICHSKFEFDVFFSLVTILNKKEFLQTENQLEQSNVADRQSKESYLIFLQLFHVKAQFIIVNNSRDACIGFYNDGNKHMFSCAIPIKIQDVYISIFAVYNDFQQQITQIVNEAAFRYMMNINFFPQNFVNAISLLMNKKPILLIESFSQLVVNDFLLLVQDIYRIVPQLYIKNLNFYCNNGNIVKTIKTSCKNEDYIRKMECQLNIDYKTLFSLPIQSQWRIVIAIHTILVAHHFITKYAKEINENLLSFYDKVASNSIQQGIVSIYTLTQELQNQYVKIVSNNDIEKQIFKFLNILDIQNKFSFLSELISDKFAQLLSEQKYFESVQSQQRVSNIKQLLFCTNLTYLQFLEHIEYQQRQNIYVHEICHWLVMNLSQNELIFGYFNYQQQVESNSTQKQKVYTEFSHLTDYLEVIQQLQSDYNKQCLIKHNSSLCSTKSIPSLFSYDLINTEQIMYYSCIGTNQSQNDIDEKLKQQLRLVDLEYEQLLHKNDCFSSVQQNDVKLREHITRFIQQKYFAHIRINYSDVLSWRFLIQKFQLPEQTYKDFTHKILNDDLQNQLIEKTKLSPTHANNAQRLLWLFINEGKIRILVSENIKQQTNLAFQIIQFFNKDSIIRINDEILTINDIVEISHNSGIKLEYEKQQIIVNQSLYTQSLKSIYQKLITQYKLENNSKSQELFEFVVQIYDLVTQINLREQTHIKNFDYNCVDKLCNNLKISSNIELFQKIFLITFFTSNLFSQSFEVSVVKREQHDCYLGFLNWDLQTTEEFLLKKSAPISDLSDILLYRRIEMHILRWYMLDSHNVIQINRNAMYSLQDIMFKHKLQIGYYQILLFTPSDISIISTILEQAKNSHLIFYITFGTDSFTSEAVNHICMLFSLLFHNKTQKYLIIFVHNNEELQVHRWLIKAPLLTLNSNISVYCAILTQKIRKHNVIINYILEKSEADLKQYILIISTQINQVLGNDLKLLCEFYQYLVRNIVCSDSLTNLLLIAFADLLQAHSYLADVCSIQQLQKKFIICVLQYTFNLDREVNLQYYKFDDVDRLQQKIFTTTKQKLFDQIQFDGYINSQQQVLLNYLNYCTTNTRKFVLQCEIVNQLILDESISKITNAKINYVKLDTIMMSELRQDKVISQLLQDLLQLGEHKFTILLIKYKSSDKNTCINSKQLIYTLKQSNFDIFAQLPTSLQRNLESKFQKTNIAQIFNTKLIPVLCFDIQNQIICLNQLSQFQQQTKLEQITQILSKFNVSSVNIQKIVQLLQKFGFDIVTLVEQLAILFDDEIRYVRFHQDLVQNQKDTVQQYSNSTNKKLEVLSTQIQIKQNEQNALLTVESTLQQTGLSTNQNIKILSKKLDEQRIRFEYISSEYQRLQQLLESATSTKLSKINQLKTLNLSIIHTLSRLKKPPMILKRIIDCLAILLNLPVQKIKNELLQITLQLPGSSFVPNQNAVESAVFIQTQSPAKLGCGQNVSLEHIISFAASKFDCHIPQKEKKIISFCPCNKCKTKTIQLISGLLPELTQLQIQQTVDTFLPTAHYHFDFAESGCAQYDILTNEYSLQDFAQHNQYIFSCSGSISLSKSMYQYVIRNKLLKKYQTWATVFKSDQLIPEDPEHNAITLTFYQPIDSFELVKHLMNTQFFIGVFNNFEYETISYEQLEIIEPYLLSPDFNHVTSQQTSILASQIIDWIFNVVCLKKLTCQIQLVEQQFNQISTLRRECKTQIDQYQVQQNILEDSILQQKSDLLDVVNKLTMKKQELSILILNQSEKQIIKQNNEYQQLLTSHWKEVVENRIGKQIIGSLLALSLQSNINPQQVMDYCIEIGIYNEKFDLSQIQPQSAIEMKFHQWELIPFKYGASIPIRLFSTIELWTSSGLSLNMVKKMVYGIQGYKIIMVIDDKRQFELNIQLLFSFMDNFSQRLKLLPNYSKMSEKDPEILFSYQYYNNLEMFINDPTQYQYSVVFCTDAEVNNNMDQLENLILQRKKNKIILVCKSQPFDKNIFHKITEPMAPTFRFLLVLDDDFIQKYQEQLLGVMLSYWDYQLCASKYYQDNDPEKEQFMIQARTEFVRSQSQFQFQNQLFVDRNEIFQTILAVFMTLKDSSQLTAQMTTEDLLLLLYLNRQQKNPAITTLQEFLYHVPNTVIAKLNYQSQQDIVKKILDLTKHMYEYEPVPNLIKPIKSVQSQTQIWRSRFVQFYGSLSMQLKEFAESGFVDNVFLMVDSLKYSDEAVDLGVIDMDNMDIVLPTDTISIFEDYIGAKFDSIATQALQVVLRYAFGLFNNYRASLLALRSESVPQKQLDYKASPWQAYAELFMPLPVKLVQSSQNLQFSKQTQLVLDQEDKPLSVTAAQAAFNQFTANRPPLSSVCDLAERCSRQGAIVPKVDHLYVRNELRQCDAQTVRGHKLSECVLFMDNNLILQLLDEYQRLKRVHDPHKLLFESLVVLGLTVFASDLQSDEVNCLLLRFVQFVVDFDVTVREAEIKRVLIGLCQTQVKAAIAFEENSVTVSSFEIINAKQCEDLTLALLLAVEPVVNDIERPLHVECTQIHQKWIEMAPNVIKSISELRAVEVFGMRRISIQQLNQLQNEMEVAGIFGPDVRQEMQSVRNEVLRQAEGV